MACATTPGTAATFKIVLMSQPIAAVSIAVASNMPTVGKATPASLSFTTANWNTPQTVTVTGLDDGSVDTMTPYSVVTAAAVSTDPNYNGVNTLDVACVNTTPPAATTPPTP